MSWAVNPATLLSRETFDPVDLLFRTQYYIAYDAKLVKPLGRRRLHSAEGGAAEASSPSLLELRAALAARIVREAPELLVNCTLRLPGDDVPITRRALRLAPAPAPSDDAQQADASPADALLRASPAATALGLLGLDAAAGGAGWAGALALALTWQVSAFTAQLADARLGAQLEGTTRPAATASLFARLGIELDAGVNTRERLAPRVPARSAAAANNASSSSTPPPPPPPSVVVPLPALAGGGAALLSSLSSWAAAAGLPAASLAPLAALAAALASRPQSNATSAVVTLPPFARRAAFVVTPQLSLGLGQLAFAVPSDARALAAALAAPTLAPLLAAEVAFENSIALWLDLAFVDAAPLAALDKRLLPRHRRRRLLAPPAPPAPAEALAAFRAAMPSAVALFAALQGVEFTQLSFQLFTGAAAVEALSADARPGVGALVEAQRFAVLRTTFAAGTRLTARLVKQP